jgi:spore coat protein U-like protein
MSNGLGNYLSYEIFSDSGRVTVWNTTNTVAYTDAGGAATSLPIYASIPAGQDTVAGEYSDTITLTITY